MAENSWNDRNGWKGLEMARNGWNDWLAKAKSG